MGNYIVNVEQLRDPPDILRIREVRDWYVEFLMKMFEGDGDSQQDYEELTAPLLVVCSENK